MDEELKEIRKAINEQKENINRERNLKTEKKKKKSRKSLGQDFALPLPGAWV